MSLQDAETLLSTAKKGGTAMNVDQTAVPRGFICQQCPEIQANVARALALAEAHEKRGDRNESDMREIKTDMKTLNNEVRDMHMHVRNGVKTSLRHSDWIILALVVLAAAQGANVISLLRAVLGK